MLQSEITAMYQQLLRVDPGGHHVFGPKSQHLVQQEAQTPNKLAPLQPLQPQGWMPPGPSMQGIEYGNPYDRR